MKATHSVALDATTPGTDILELQSALKARVVGQNEAVDKVSDVLQSFYIGFNAPQRPVANLLFLGPTGTGKTRLVEALADVLFHNDRSFLKVDCGEFHHSHEVSKILGSPPGYLGHRQTSPLITQEKLDKFHTKDLKLSLVLFDEIEKANQSFWDLLLAVLDKAEMTLGDGSMVDFTHSLIFMTSNLGAEEMSKLVSGMMGFSHSERGLALTNQRLAKIATNAARKRFSPEFINRLDKLVVFNTLQSDDLRRILRIELGQVQKRILSSHQHQKFVLSVSTAAEDFLLREQDQRYGARELKRSIEQHVVKPLSNLVSTGQVVLGDIVQLDVINEGLTFSKIPGDEIERLANTEWGDFTSPVSESGI